MPDFTVSDLLREIRLAFPKNPYNILPEDKIKLMFDPNFMPVIPNSRDIYPDQVNYDGDLIAEIKRDEKAGSGYCTVKLSPGLNDEGKFATEKFNGAFYLKINEKVRKLRAAAAIFNEIWERTNRVGYVRFADYLNQLAEDTEKMEGKYPFTKSDVAMIRIYTEDPLFPIIFTSNFGYNYPDKFGMKMFPGGTLAIETAECRKLTDAFTSGRDLQYFEDLLPYAPAIRKNVPNLPDKIFDIVANTGYCSTSGMGLAVTYRPEGKEELDKYGAVIAGWRQVLEKKADIILRKIVEQIVPEDFLSKYGSKFSEILPYFFVLGINWGHEIGHFLGDKKDSEQLRRDFGENFNYLNEDLAELSRLFFFRHRIGDGTFGYSREELVRMNNQLYVAEIVRHIRFGKENAYGEAARRRLKFLVDSSAVEITEDLEIAVNHDVFMDVITSAYAYRLKMFQEGNCEMAEEYKRKTEITEGSQLDNQIIAILEKVNSSGIKKDLFPEYDFTIHA